MKKHICSFLMAVVLLCFSTFAADGSDIIKRNNDQFIEFAMHHKANSKVIIEKWLSVSPSDYDATVIREALEKITFKYTDLLNAKIDFFTQGRKHIFKQIEFAYGDLRCDKFMEMWVDENMRIFPLAATFSGYILRIYVFFK